MFPGFAISVQLPFTPALVSLVLFLSHSQPITVIHFVGGLTVSISNFIPDSPAPRSAEAAFFAGFFPLFPCLFPG